MPSKLTRALADPGRRSPAAWARRRRFELLSSVIDEVRPRRILDVGGEPRAWELTGFADVEVVLLNIALPAARPTLPNLRPVVGDARSMPEFGDGEFDLVFSNSVIEHVGNALDQRRMADEIRRIGRSYFVQTPNRAFPVEPHFLTIGFQFLPVAVRASLLQRRRLGQYERRPDRADALRAVEGIRLLSRREFGAMLPDAELVDERVLGLTKSFMAIRRAPQGASPAVSGA